MKCQINPGKLLWGKKTPLQKIPQKSMKQEHLLQSGTISLRTQMKASKMWKKAKDTQKDLWTLQPYSKLLSHKRSCFVSCFIAQVGVQIWHKKGCSLQPFLVFTQPIRTSQLLTICECRASFNLFLTRNQPFVPFCGLFVGSFLVKATCYEHWFGTRVLVLVFCLPKDQVEVARLQQPKKVRLLCQLNTL